jgi:hypothetical protein
VAISVAPLAPETFELLPLLLERDWEVPDALLAEEKETDGVSSILPSPCDLECKALSELFVCVAGVLRLSGSQFHM